MRTSYDDITIRETESGPEIVFDGGVQGWVTPCTEADLAVLESRLTERRQAQAAGLLGRQGR